MVAQNTIMPFMPFMHLISVNTGGGGVWSLAFRFRALQYFADKEGALQALLAPVNAILITFPPSLSL